MLRLLAIETATEACSVALLLGHEIQERFEIAPRRHAALLLPFADALLADAGLVVQQLDAIAFGFADQPLPEKLDLAFVMQENDFMGRRSIQLNVKDFRLAEN